MHACSLRLPRDDFRCRASQPLPARTHQRSPLSRQSIVHLSTNCEKRQWCTNRWERTRRAAGGAETNLAVRRQQAFLLRVRVCAVAPAASGTTGCRHTRDSSAHASPRSLPLCPTVPCSAPPPLSWSSWKNALGGQPWRLGSELSTSQTVHLPLLRHLVRVVVRCAVVVLGSALDLLSAALCEEPR